MKLLNRIAVVTGAASGIGGRAAVRLAGEGAKLFLMDVNPDGLEATRSEILASGGEAVACPCDVSDEAAVKAAVMQAIDSLQGKMTMLIIAHRLSTIKNCNIVYKVENGSVTVQDAQ